MKTVYQTDEAGYFVGTTSADRDPLVDGNLLIPARCVEFAPPEIPAGKRALLVGRAWKLEDIPVAEPEVSDQPEPQQAAAIAQFSGDIDTQIHNFYAEFSYEAWEFGIVVTAAALYISGTPSNLIESEAAEFGMTPDKFARRIIELHDMQQAFMLNAVSMKRVFAKKVKTNSGKSELAKLLQEQRDLLKADITKIKDKKPVSNPNKPVALKA